MVRIWNIWIILYYSLNALQCFCHTLFWVLFFSQVDTRLQDSLYELVDFRRVQTILFQDTDPQFIGLVSAAKDVFDNEIWRFQRLQDVFACAPVDETSVTQHLTSEMHHRALTLYPKHHRILLHSHKIDRNRRATRTCPWPTDSCQRRFRRQSLRFLWKQKPENYSSELPTNRYKGWETIEIGPLFKS